MTNSPMTALNKQALRKLATDAHELGIIKRYTKGIEANKRFVAIATPLTFLALLDELEAAEKRIAELEANKGKPVMFIDGDISASDAEKLAAVIREWDDAPAPALQEEMEVGKWR
ncbi:TPA: ead/Ea22-like family protein [Citrobacter freundii]|nr:ead/Ea22-like family protein [Citrobacter freundii]HCW3405793.1 ead/Ea22-like family protein [Citrobacter freundii]